MDETTQRRLLGAAVLFLTIYGIASLLPDHGSGSGGTGSNPQLESVPDNPPKVVVYDLNTPEPAPAKSAAADGDAAPPAPAAPKPVAPVLTLEPPAHPSGASLGWYVQIGSYATKPAAQAALSRLGEAGYSGTVQEILKDKKKLFRTRVGPFSSNEEAQRVQQAAVELGFADARRVEVLKP